MDKETMIGTSVAPLTVDAGYPGYGGHHDAGEPVVLAAADGVLAALAVERQLRGRERIRYRW